MLLSNMNFSSPMKTSNNFFNNRQNLSAKQSSIISVQSDYDNMDNLKLPNISLRNNDITIRSLSNRDRKRIQTRQEVLPEERKDLLTFTPQNKDKRSYSARDNEVRDKAKQYARIRQQELLERRSEAATSANSPNEELSGLELYCLHIEEQKQLAKARWALDVLSHDSNSSRNVNSATTGARIELFQTN